MATRKRATTPEPGSDAPEATSAADTVKSISHRAKRKNIPPAGLEAQGRVEESPKVRFEYNPHLPPVLRFADEPAAADRLPPLLATAPAPAAARAPWRGVADKVIDPRGNEGLRVVTRAADL